MTRNLKRSIYNSIRALLTGLFVMLLVATARLPASAAGVVGSGSPASCTEAAFDTALAGGGLVTFNCGPNPHTIGLSYYKQINVDTEIDGGGLITLSGKTTVPHFQVYYDTTLTLRDITLSSGKGDFGSIENFGELVLIDSQVRGNQAMNNGGGIVNYGTTTLTQSTVAENSSGNSGGGIMNDGGTVFLYESQVLSNTAVAQGQGIFNTFRMEITDSLIAGNQIFDTVDGGGIYNTGILTLTQSTLSDNQAYNGGGIYNAGSLQMEAVTFEGNIATYFVGSGGGLYNNSYASGNQVIFDDNYAISYGGGLYNSYPATLELVDSTFTHNDATVGGGLVTAGVMTMTHSTVYSNTASSGSGIAQGVSGPDAYRLTLTNVTVSDNASDSVAAGLWVNAGTAYVTYSTFADNRGDYAISAGAPGQIYFLNTIVSESQAVNCAEGSTITSYGFNISSDGTCPFTNTGDRLNTDPLLGPLANNGGDTLTHLPGTGSLAIDGGQCQPGITDDQRGYPRNVGASCDIGAVEVGGLLPRAYLPIVQR